MGKYFDDKVALITGGASGIGAACAERLAQKGVRVGIVDLNLAAAEVLVGRITASGGEALAVEADISSDHDNRAAFNSVRSAFGKIDFAFLNAGAVQTLGTIEDNDLATFDRMVAINLRGTFMGIKLAHEFLGAGGVCVATGSGGSILGFSEAIAYTAAKHGVIGLVKACALDFAARGLRIHAICPGTVLTPMIGAPATDGIVPVEAIERPDFRGALTPQTVAEAVILLFSPGAVGLNGLVQPVDAGLTSTFAPMAKSVVAAIRSARQ